VNVVCAATTAGFVAMAGGKTCCGSDLAVGEVGVGVVGVAGAIAEE